MLETRAFEPEFLQKVFEIRDIIENLASSTRAGDD